MKLKLLTQLASAANSLLSPLGYRVVSTRTPSIPLGQYEHLLAAYEHLFQLKEEYVLPPNDVRGSIMTRLRGTPPPEAYFIVQALARSSSVAGDVCEFGVAQGETSALIASEIRLSTRRLHLFDSFEGLPEPTERDELIDDIFGLGNVAAYKGTMRSPKDSVLDRLSSIAFPAERYQLHEGFIERVLDSDEALPTSVSFAYVDFDFYEPIRRTLGFLDSVVPTGGIIIVDDYGFFSSGVKTAVDEFVAGSDGSAGRYTITVPDTRFGHFAILARR